MTTIQLLPPGLRRARRGLATLAATLALSIGLAGTTLAATDAVADAQAASPASERSSANLARVDEIIAQLANKPALFAARQTAAQQAQTTRLVQQLATLLQTLDADVDAVVAELQAQRSALVRARLSPDMLARYDQTLRDLRSRAAALQALGRAWRQNPTAANLAAVQQFLQQYPAAKRQAPADAAQLPWALPQPNTRAPATTKTSWFQNLHRDQKFALAQAGGTVGGISFNIAPEPSQTPVLADLAETPEVQLSAAIKAQAQALGNNPVAITQWVRNNLRWLPTWGAAQRADQVLESRAGNAIDTANLLVALLRAANIPARYQFGTIDLPADKVQNWVGGVATPEAAVDLLNRGGIAAQGLTQSGAVTTIRMEHAWVQAYVNWTPSRGNRNASASQHVNPNGPLNAWVPLDASFKQYSPTPGADLASLAAFNAQGLVQATKQSASCTAASANGLNLAALGTGYTAFAAQARTQLNTLGADLRLSDLLGTNPMTGAANAAPTLLAGTLAYPVVLQATPSAALTDAVRWSLHMSLRQGGSTVLDLAQPFAALQGRELVLRFVPQTSADAQALALLLAPNTATGDPATGLPGSIAAYLIRFKAQWWLDGQLLSEGGTFQGGDSLTLRTEVQTPDAGTPSVQESIVTAGETHAWHIQSASQGAAGAARAAALVSSLKTQLASATPPSSASQAANWLHALAWSYQAILDSKVQLQQRVASAIEVRLPSVVRASSRLQAQVNFGVVTQLRPGGVALQVDRYGSISTARNNPAQSAAQNAAYAQQSLARASAAAHLLLDQVLGQPGQAPSALSAVSALAQAASLSQPVYWVDSTTLSQVLPSMDSASALYNRLSDIAANGQRALVTPAAVALGGISVDPLVVQDPASGAAGYSVVARATPQVEATAQRAGLQGWLGLMDDASAKAVINPTLDATLGQLNTAQLLQADPATVRWQGFAGQSDLLGALYLSRLAAQVQGANPCDWLIATVAAQLSGGLPGATAVNRAPVISSQPVTLGLANSSYSYAVQASDADGDALTYSVQGAPTGMAINASGNLQWLRAVPGQYSLTVTVSDGKATAQQSYVLNVPAASDSLQLQASLTPTIADAGQTAQLQVSASAPAGRTVALSATLDGAPLSLAAGQASFNAPASGTHRILVTANDGQTTLTRELLLSVRNPADTTLPVAAITAPADTATVRGLLPIIGTASAANLAYYRLQARLVGSGDAAWREIGRGLTSVANGTLGMLDTTTLQQGLYDVALQAVDVNGNASVASVVVEVAGDLKLGQFRLAFTDVRADALGLPLMLTRTYDSTRRDQLGDFGYGWSASNTDVTVRKNMPLGSQWNVTTSGFQICLAPAGKRRITVTLPDGGLYRFDAQNAQQCAFAQVPEVNLQFITMAGGTGGAAGRTSATAQLALANAVPPLVQGGMLVDTDTGEPWNPTDFDLTTEDGFIYRLREGVGVLSVTDPYGNHVDYGSNGYQHSANLGIAITRDSQGRITRATDPAGQALSYQYNSSGELASVTDRAGGVTRFAYASVTPTSNTANGGASGNDSQQHLLVSITDPRGQVVMSNQFDSLGRLTASADANGQASQQQFDLPNNRQTLTDRRGNSTTYTFDADGNITQVVDALGQTTRYTFDANGNETSVTNPLGQTTLRSFDASTGKQLTERDPLGNTTSTVYSTGSNAFQRQNPLTTTDARGNPTSYEYGLQVQQPGATPVLISESLGRSTSISVNPNTGNLNSLSVAGSATSYQYDAQGRKTLETDAAGSTTSYTYDTSGNELSRSITRTLLVNGTGQARTETTTRQYDAENRVIAETDATGATRSTSYNAAGKPVTQTDALGRITRYSYDANARLTATQYPDGSSDATSYDANGNETTKTDRAGRITRHTYDALNRLVATQYPDGSSDSTEYDAAGRITASVDAKGKRSTQEYDAAGRMSASVSPTGLRTENQFDANGNRTRTTSAAGTPNARTTTYSYDALNRLTSTSYPDGSSQTASYRPDGRKDSETDPRGVTTSYAYDALGRLSGVQQTGVSATTTYAYDQASAKTTQTDANGRSTQWSYDAAGRPTSHRLPDGSTESFQYDAQGRVTVRTSFAGQALTSSYDSADRETARTIPAASGPAGTAPARSLQWTYTADGQRATQTESGASANTGQTSYGYDAQGWLTQLTTPQGSLAWSYDATGNITQRTTPEGTTGYQYDDDGKLIQLTAPDGKTTTYSYDSAGRVSRSVQQLDTSAGSPVNLVTDKRYDSQDRQVAIAHSRQAGNASATLIAGQAITRGAGGAVSRIDTYGTSASFDQATGSFTGTASRSQVFGYDANARLQSEAEYSNTQLSQTTVYGYDLVGNRVSKTVTPGTGTATASTTAYSYDQNDRLTTETTVAGTSTQTTSYTWDGNGNLAAKQTSGGSASSYTGYVFDADNRLIEVKRGTTQATATMAASYGYDADGQRIRKTVNGQTTYYLIDPTTQWPQVALEKIVSGNSTQSTAYVWGNELRRQTRGTHGTTYGAGQAEDLIPLQGHLGTTIAAVNKLGQLGEAYRLDAFGNAEDAASASAKANHLYAGEYLDADTGIVYLRDRWYDAGTARFLSGDRLTGRSIQPKSLSRYGYGWSDPVHNTDPSGRESLGGLMSALDAGVQTALAGIRAGFATSASAGGMALRTLGGVVESSVGQILARTIGSGGTVRNGVSLVGPGGRRVIDFLIQVGQRSTYLEVKYGLPKTIGPAMVRLVGQMRTATSAAAGANGEVVLFTYAAPSEAQMLLLLAELGETASSVRVISGFVELSGYLRVFLLGI